MEQRSPIKPSNLDEDTEQYEDDFEKEFPFDLSEWTVVDADDDDNEDDVMNNASSKSKDIYSHAETEKNNTCSSQTKRHQDPQRSKRSNSKDDAKSRKSSEKSTAAKKVFSTHNSSSTASSSNTDKNSSLNSTYGKTTKIIQHSNNKRPSSDSKSSSCIAKVPQVPKGTESSSSGEKTSVLQTAKQVDRASSVIHKTNHNSKSSLPGSTTTLKPVPVTQTIQQKHKDISVKTSSPNQTSKTPSPKVSATPAKAAALNVSSSTSVFEMDKSARSASQQVHGQMNKESAPSKVISGAKPPECSVSASKSITSLKEKTPASVTESKPSLTAQSTKTPTTHIVSHQGASSQTQARTSDKKGSNTQSLSSPTTGIASKPELVSSKSLILPPKLDSVESKNSLQRPAKCLKSSESAGEIAEAMDTDVDFGDLLNVFDMDSDESEKHKGIKLAQTEVSKKRLSQNELEDVGKKARYDRKNDDISIPNSKTQTSKESDECKISVTDGKKLQINTKRIVRRFHRTTQTISKNASTVSTQCSISLLPSRSPAKKHHSNTGIQCKIGDKFDHVARLLNSNIATVANTTIKREVLKAALAFGVSSLHPDIVLSGSFKYGLRIGHVTQSDVDKILLKDNFIKKADSYAISFLEKECGIFDCFFHGEENFISVLNQIRKIRIGSRYLCVTVLKNLNEKDQDSSHSYDNLKATVVFDQNFDSTGFFSYQNTPIWNKPKVEEFVTLHNVPGNVPLSFLNLIFPDAISVLMRDVKLNCTRKGGGVRLGLNRKNGGSGLILKLFTQVLINNTPVFLTQGLTEKKDVPEMQGTSKIMVDVIKLEKERDLEKSYIRTLTATARDINDGKKRVADKSKNISTGNNSSKTGGSPKKDKMKGSSHNEHDVNSDFSDISISSFNASYTGSGKEEIRPEKENKRHQSQKKIEPKKSLAVTMGSKLLNRARTNIHQSQSRRHNDRNGKSSGIGIRQDSDRRIIKSRDVSSHSQRRDTQPDHSKDLRSAEHRFKDVSSNRHNDNQERNRSRTHQNRDEHVNDRSCEGLASRHGSWNQREPDIKRSRNERSPLDHRRQNTSHNRSSEKDVSNSNRTNSDRAHKSRERHDVEDRLRTRNGDRLDFGHRSLSKSDSHERTITRGRPDQMATDIRNSEDLRTILDSKKPKEDRLGPRRYDNTERIRASSPGRFSGSHERRKRPLSRSPSLTNRKVIIARRSHSPRNQPRRQGGSRDSLQSPFLSQSQSSKNDVFERKDEDLRNVQPGPRQFHSEVQQQNQQRGVTEEDEMTISKSLFVKLLANALHEDDGSGSGQIPSGPAGPQLNSYSRSPLRDETAMRLSQIRGQDSGERSNVNTGINNSSSNNNHNNNNNHFGNYRQYNQMRPDFNERNNFGPRGSNKDGFQQVSSNLPRCDPKPIPPPVMPPMFTSSSVNYKTNDIDSRGGYNGERSGSTMSQGTWAAPPQSSSFNMMPERTPVTPATLHKPPLAHTPQIRPPFNVQPPMMFPRHNINKPPPPFIPPAQQGHLPNTPQGVMPPPSQQRWQNPHSRLY